MSDTNPDEVPETTADETTDEAAETPGHEAPQTTDPDPRLDAIRAQEEETAAAFATQGRLPHAFTPTTAAEAMREAYGEDVGTNVGDNA